MKSKALTKGLLSKSVTKRYDDPIPLVTNIIIQLSLNFQCFIFPLSCVPVGNWCDHGQQQYSQIRVIRNMG